MSLEVKLETFEGPLDLLLNLINKNQVDIYDIPIALITSQYMDYLNKMKEMDMAIASEFILMAATLLDIKCRMLLPKEVNEEGEEIDPRAELVEQLLEYKLCKYMSDELRGMQIDAERNCFKKNTMPPEFATMRPPVDYEKLIGNTNLITLNRIFEDMMRRQEDRIDPVRSRFGHIEKEELNLAARNEEILTYIKSHKRFRFRELLSTSRSKIEVIVTFLSVLEFIRDGVLLVEQNEDEDDIEFTATGKDYRPGEKEENGTEET